jgi:DNA-binding transcriptional MerR regulator
VPSNALPDKLFFKIGEVAQIVGVAAHVLRYWESEFNALRPLKTRGSHRVYRRRDVELAVLLKRLLHEEGLTIAGAKRRLRERGQYRIAVPSAPRELRDDDQRAELIAMRDELTGLLSALDSALREDGEAAGHQAKDEASAEGAGCNADENGSSRSVPVHARKHPVS